MYVRKGERVDLEELEELEKMYEVVLIEE